MRSGFLTKLLRGVVETEGERFRSEEKIVTVEEGSLLRILGQLSPFSDIDALCVLIMRSLHFRVHSRHIIDCVLLRKLLFFTKYM